MKTAIIIHGTDASPDANWFPWLKKELEIFGYQVIVPQFPQSRERLDDWNELDAWFNAFEPYRKFVSKGSILIAHSKGAVFCYHLLPTFHEKLRAVFLVAPWYAYHWYRPGKKLSTFHRDPFRWDLLKDTADYFEVYQSTNDIIEPWEGEKIANDLAGNAVIVRNAGHFNTNSDKKFIQFPLLLNHIKKRLV